MQLTRLGCLGLVVMMLTMTLGCLGQTASAKCGFSGYVVSLAEGEHAPSLSKEVEAKYPNLREALNKTYGTNMAGISSCPNRPMIQDILSLGGTGVVSDDYHGWALVNSSNVSWRIEWTVAPGGEV